ncbi:ABC transporter permease [Oceanobacillus jeddahense]|uniref:ABC transporter permease n=1 Tax=Oceanobacillus jeddahense TaxID=1462527 RepID=A0ABY5JX44_9BACI|nr:ABC transporter permease [Oceanobacillus jeddahense]UUI04963.1 ABC transporter permease [Oceanobacillus jeddahense]
MFNSFYTELIKLKRSNIFIISFLAILIPIILTLIPPVINNMLSEGPLEAGYFFDGNLAFLNLTIGIPLFSIIAVNIFVKEYQQGTINFLFTSLQDRKTIYFGKLMTSFVSIVVVFLLSFLLNGIIVLVGSKYGFVETVNLSVFLNYLLVYLLSILMQLALLPIVIIVGIWFKNIVIPMGCAILGVLIAGIGLQSEWAFYFPWSIPLKTVQSITDGGSNVTFISTPILALGFILVISTIISLVLYNTEEVT